MTTRFALFDWTPGGHHALYVRRFVEAYRDDHELVVAVPDEVADEVTGLGAEVHPLGPARPALDPSRPLPPQNREIAETELVLLRRVAAAVRPDHLVHLYADPVLRRLVTEPPFPVPVSLLVHFPRAHYKAAFGTDLGAKEQARAWFQETLIARWRRRPDAHALLTIDEEAARRWAARPPGRGAAPAFWVPEPPVARLPADLDTGPHARDGVALYGSLAPRKGIDLLAAAVASAPTTLKVTVAGVVEDGYAPALAAAEASMRAAGADVDVRGWRHDETAGLRVLAAARAVVLPYPRYYEMSRVLLEACEVGTPVVVNDFGLLGHLVRTRGLGLAVDCADPAALRAALDQLAGDPGAPARHAPALAAFAAEYAPARFRAAATAPFAYGHPAPAAPTVGPSGTGR